MTSSAMVALDSSAPPGGVLRRAALILDVFAAQTASCSTGRNLTQIVFATGLPQASVHRTLEQLVALGWLSREGMQYRLGMRLAELGSAAVNDDALRLAALPSMRWLHLQTRCVVQLATLDGDEVVYLERVGGESVPAIKTRVGSRIPARQSTIGAALLSLEPGDSAAELDIASVRNSRIAYRRDGCLEGFACIAAPIGPYGRSQAAAISVFGTAQRVADDVQIRRWLQAAAATIWQRLNTASGVRAQTQR